jgi:hypothetical protein
MKLPKFARGKPAEILIELDKKTCNSLIHVAKLRGLDKIPFRTFLVVFLKENLKEWIIKYTDLYELSDGRLVEQLNLLKIDERKGNKK